MQLCVSDVVEDLMEGMSLAAESEKSLSSQEPESQHGVRPVAVTLQGETAVSLITLLGEVVGFLV